MPKMYRTQAYLSKTHRNYLKAVGNNEISQGIRMLIKYHNTHEEMIVKKGRPQKNNT